MLNNRIKKLENWQKINITIEDIIRLIRNKDSLTPIEQHRIISSKFFQQIKALTQPDKICGRDGKNTQT